MVCDGGQLVAHPVRGRGRSVAYRPGPVRPVSLRCTTGERRRGCCRSTHRRRPVSTGVTAALAGAAALITPWLGSLAHLSGQSHCPAQPSRTEGRGLRCRPARHFSNSRPGGPGCTRRTGRPHPRPSTTSSRRWSTPARPLVAPTADAGVRGVRSRAFWTASGRKWHCRSTRRYVFLVLEPWAGGSSNALSFSAVTRSRAVDSPGDR